jgi:polygalacturonase
MKRRDLFKAIGSLLFASLVKDKKPKMLTICSVTTFGAIGDGITDDSEAFQRAVDSGVHVVDVPPGTYNIGHTVSLNSATKIVGHESTFISRSGNTLFEDRGISYGYEC